MNQLIHMDEGDYNIGYGNDDLLVNVSENRLTDNTNALEYSKIINTSILEEDISQKERTSLMIIDK